MKEEDGNGVRRWTFIDSNLGLFIQNVQFNSPFIQMYGFFCILLLIWPKIQSLKYGIKKENICDFSLKYDLLIYLKLFENCDTLLQILWNQISMLVI